MLECGGVTESRYVGTPATSTRDGEADEWIPKDACMDTAVVERRVNRSIGKKAAKRIQKKEAIGKMSIESSAIMMAQSIENLNEVPVQERKVATKERELLIEKRRLDWNMAKSLFFVKDSVATDEERMMGKRLHRKRLLISLNEAENEGYNAQGITGISGNPMGYPSSESSSSSWLQPCWTTWS